MVPHWTSKIYLDKWFHILIVDNIKTSARRNIQAKKNINLFFRESGHVPKLLIEYVEELLS